MRDKARPRRPAEPGPCKDDIAARLAAAAPDAIQSNGLPEEIGARGCAGGERVVTVHEAELRAAQAAPADPVMRFETAPGEQMRVDWASMRRGRERLSVFVATLGWSRAAHAGSVADERVETLIGCHERAFLTFGGGPRKRSATVRRIRDRSGGSMPRRTERVVIDRDAHGRGRHRVHAALSDVAGPGGFRPRLCRPCRAQGEPCGRHRLETHGGRERSGGFVRCLRGRLAMPFASRMAQDGLVVDAPAATAAVTRWLRETANARVHATTGAVPAGRLNEERPALQPIPAPRGGTILRSASGAPAAGSSPCGPPPPIIGLQHPLSVCEALGPAPGAMAGEARP